MQVQREQQQWAANDQQRRQFLLQQQQLVEQWNKEVQELQQLRQQEVNEHLLHQQLHQCQNNAIPSASGNGGNEGVAPIDPDALRMQGINLTVMDDNPFILVGSGRH